MFGKVDDILFLFAFQLVGVGDEILHAAVLSHQLRRGFFSNARNARYVVGGITPESQNVDKLLGLLDTIALADFLWSPDLCRLTELGGLVKQYFVSDKLPEVLVGSHHIGKEALLLGFF